MHGVRKKKKKSKEYIIDISMDIQRSFLCIIHLCIEMDMRLYGLRSAVSASADAAARSSEVNVRAATERRTLSTRPRSGSSLGSKFIPDIQSSDERCVV